MVGCMSAKHAKTSSILGFGIALCVPITGKNTFQNAGTATRKDDQERKATSGPYG